MLEPQFLLIVADEAAPSPVTVDEGNPETPGYAQASALHPEGGGRWTWAQATLSTECAGPEHFLVVLGSDIWQWDKDNDDEDLEAVEVPGRTDDGPAGRGDERRHDDGAGTDSPCG
jgi:hypothetical protein